MRVAWKCYPHLLQGNTAGYAVANAGYQHALRLAGYEVVEVEQAMHLDLDPEIVLHWSVPELYAPFPGKINIYGTVSEALNVRPAFRACFDHPLTTAIFTPSSFCQRIFRCVTHKPVFLCGHGVESETFGYVQRAWSQLAADQRPFVFLYVGSSNPRKGSDFLFEWWQSREWQHVWVGLHGPPVRLYLKVSDLDFAKACLELWRMHDRPVRQEYGGLVYQDGTVTVDTRHVPAEVLAVLYQHAHCFVFPSRGEGFGLTLAEAMSTGLPCVATRFSGYLDYCNEDTAFLVDFTPTPLLGINGRTFIGAAPDKDDWCRQVQAVLADYRGAVVRGTRAAVRMRQEVTWSRVSQQMRAMLEVVAGATTEMSVPSTGSA